MILEPIEETTKRRRTLLRWVDAEALLRWAWASVLILLFFYYDTLAEPLEPVLEPATRWGTALFLRIFGGTVQIGGPSSPLFVRTSSLIGTHCFHAPGLGLLAFSCFAGLVGFFWIFDRQRFGFRGWLAALLGALFAAYLVNVVRFGLLLLTEYKFRVWYGPSPAVRRVSDMIGGSLGLPLYAGALLLFFATLHVAGRPVSDREGATDAN